MRSLGARTFAARTFRARTLHGPVPVVDTTAAVPTRSEVFTSAHYGPGGPHGGAASGYETRARRAPTEYEDILFRAYGPPPDIAPIPDAPVEPEPIEPKPGPIAATNRLADALRAVDAENAARRRLEGALKSIDEIDARRQREARGAHDREVARLEAEEDVALLLLLTMA